jgi:hypothetical protein
LPPCDTQADCEEGRLCIDDACHGACTSNDDCRGFYRSCDDASGACVECVDTADCEQGDVCEDHSCRPGTVETVCVANSIGCIDEQTAFVCNADGSARVEAPCRDDQLCEGGQCLLLVCEPGTQICSGATVITCNADGTESTATACGDASMCEAEFGCACVEGSCQARSCEPLSGRCVGNSAQRCDAQGLSFDELSPCGAELCVAGLCLDDTCTPGAGFCSGRTLVQCDDDGVGYHEVDCPDTCDGAIGEAACAAQVCEPLSQACNGDSVVICDATGTEQLEVPCANNQYCDQGACLDRACEPNSRVCLGEDVLVCNALGSATEVALCPDGTTCNGGQCVDDGCTPDCSGRACGPDPQCGLSCGGCAGVCDDSGQCLLDGPQLEVLVSGPGIASLDIDAYLARGDTAMCSTDSCGYATCKRDAIAPPNWDGVSGRSAADPLLDVIDGVVDNPETIRLTLLGPERYRAGAHLFHDADENGATPRAVTIRVLLDGTERGSFTRTLEPKQLWDGVVIVWDGATVSTLDVGGLDADFECEVPPPPDACTTDEECDPGEICVDDGNLLVRDIHCRLGCRADADCGGVNICNGNNDCAAPGSVVPWKTQCSEDADCDVGFHCGFFTQLCEEDCLPGCTPGVDCCLSSGGDTCFPDPLFQILGTCEA